MRPWNLTVLIVALISVGAGIMGGVAVSRIDSPWAGLASTLVLWVAMLVPVMFAFVRSRPVGLLRFRAIDVLYALTLGVGLRVVQGALAGDRGGFPSIATLDGSLPDGWWLTEALPTVVGAPLVEEFFFRAVLLIVVYQLLRRMSGGVAAGFAALLISTGAFILLHGIGGVLPLGDAVAVGAVGLTCSLLVLLTGRIWGAVLTHVVYNTTYLALTIIGTVLA